MPGATEEYYENLNQGNQPLGWQSNLGPHTRGGGGGGKPP